MFQRAIIIVLYILLSHNKPIVNALFHLTWIKNHSDKKSESQSQDPFSEKLLLGNITRQKLCFLRHLQLDTLCLVFRFYSS